MALAVAPRVVNGCVPQRVVSAVGGRVEAPRVARVPTALGLGALESEELRRAAEQRALAAEGRLLVVSARLSSVEGRLCGRERAAAALGVDCAAIRDGAGAAEAGGSDRGGGAGAGRVAA